jgi:hypothetical protein
LHARARAHTHTHTQMYVTICYDIRSTHAMICECTHVVKCAWVSNATTNFWNILTYLCTTARCRTTNKFKFRYISVKEMT